MYILSVTKGKLCKKSSGKSLMLKEGRTLVLFGLNPGCGKLYIYFRSLKWTFHRLSRLLDKFSGTLCSLSQWALVPLAGWNYQRNWQRIQLIPQSVCPCAPLPLRLVLCREHPGRTTVAPVCWVSPVVLRQDPLKAGALGENVPSVATGTHPENSRKPPLPVLFSIALLSFFLLPLSVPSSSMSTIHLSLPPISFHVHSFCFLGHLVIPSHSSASTSQLSLLPWFHPLVLAFHGDFVLVQHRWI